MPRFVILRHECPADYARPSHWDLMLECGPALRTWALVDLPREWLPHLAAKMQDGDKVEQPSRAEQLPPHRLNYLDFEGPLSGQRGDVRRVEAGTYTVLTEAEDLWELHLRGAALAGRLRLVRDVGDACYWRLDWSPD